MLTKRHSPDDAIPGAVATATDTRKAFQLRENFDQAFNQVVTEFTQYQEKALELAAARRDGMLELMANDPEQALNRAISRSQYAALPDDLKPFFEQPFSATGNLQVISICNSDTHPESIHHLTIDANNWQATVIGKRLVHTSKKNTPLSGITLGKRAVISDQVFETVSSEDEPAIAALPLGNPDAARDFLTGEPLTPNAITTLAGGKRYLVNPSTDLAAANERLAALDEKIGPRNGSQLLFSPVTPSDPTQAVNWNALELQAIILASAWTESPKPVFFIRVDFPDKPGAVESQADLAALLNTQVADTITEMSYGKTTIIADVSPMTVRLPYPTTHYLPNGGEQLYDDALSAYLALNGPTALDGYEIIGVQHPWIDLPYGGTASRGGSRQSIQGTQGLYTFVHEFGHNYGLGHASFWRTTDGSVIGTGTDDEYGDLFDIMGSGLYRPNHFHMQAKQALNWLDVSQWHDTSSSGIQRVYRFDHPNTTGTTRGLRITKGTSPNEYYWVGFRYGLPNHPLLQNGAYLLWQRPGQPNSWLLDTTPDSPAGSTDSAITLGKTYTDAAANIHITPVTIGGSVENRYLDINVQFGPFPQNLPPSATLNAAATAEARNLLTLTVNASDPNSDTLAYSWDFGDSTPSINSPTVIHNWLAAGNYTISVTVTDMKGGSATMSQNITVSDPLNSWTTRSSGTTTNFQAIASGGGKVVAVGHDNGTSRVSTDGVTWSSGTAVQNVMFYGITYANNQFIAVGQGYDFSSTPNGWKGVIYTSPNGIDWTLRHIAGPTLKDVCFGNGTYVAVGDGATVLISSDNATWTTASTGTTTDLRGIDFGNNTFVAVGSAPDGSNVSVVTSTDGSTWANHSPGAGVDSWKGFNNIHFARDRFLATGWKSRVRHSTDNGVSFQTRETKFLLAPGLAYGNSIFFAAGIEESALEPDLNMISIDGENWTALSTADQPTRNAAIFFNNTFITVGNNGSIRQSDPFTAPQTDPYIAWKNFYFTGNPPLSNDADDYDRDGIPNIGEYATGSNPKNPTDRVTIDFSIISGNLTISIPKNPSALGVTTRVESSLNLVQWGTNNLLIEQETPYLMVVRHTTTVPTPGVNQGFLRVVFER